MMALLKEKKCLPCQGGVPPLDHASCRKMLHHLESRWHLNGRGDRLFCSLEIPQPSRNVSLLFREIGELSERENHHPELRWWPERFDVQIWTHKIGALVESDFILAAKIDDILMESGIPITSFDAIGNGNEWSVLGEDAFFGRFTFGNFREPLERALRLLEPSEGVDGESFGVGLGYGFLEVRVVAPRGQRIADKINAIMSV